MLFAVIYLFRDFFLPKKSFNKIAIRLKMYFLSKFCCLCMSKSDLKLMFDEDNDGVSHYKKLISSIAEMDFQEMNKQRLICGECCLNLKTVYNFRQKCLRSKTNLISYIAQLQTFSKVSGTLSVCLKDMKHEIKVENGEIHIKIEEENSSFQDNKSSGEFHSEKCEENVNLNVLVKKEIEIDEDAGFTCEKSMVDHENESAQNEIVTVKVEPEQTMMEEDYYTESSETGMEKDPLVTVKDEPLSDIEAPQDGCTSQEDKFTKENFGGLSKKNNSNRKYYVLKKDLTRMKNSCVICKKKFSSKARLDNHMRIHSDQNPYKCKMCDMTFKLKYFLNEHILTHTGETPYECEICRKVFFQKATMDTHMRVHSGETSYECEICKKKFSHTGHLNMHKRIHTGEGTFECEICKKKFVQMGNLNAHMLTHTDERPYECEICKEKFIQARSLVVHIRKHTGERPYECEICLKDFRGKSCFSKHMKSHLGEKFECEICEKKFIIIGDLNAHMRKHSDIRPHECDICGEKFNQSRCLQIHIRKHTGERPYECKICQKDFRSKSCFTKHMRIHSGEKPYECEICQKKFNQMGHLNTHLRIHTGEKPYECETCKERFNTKGSCKRHMRRKHSTGDPAENVSVIDVKNEPLSE